MRCYGSILAPAEPRTEYKNKGLVVSRKAIIDAVALEDVARPALNPPKIKRHILTDLGTYFKGENSGRKKVETSVTDIHCILKAFYPLLPDRENSLLAGL